jgi:Na+-transporting NADH:ubiquinone oxidoreductase subunit NqrC
MSLTDIKKELKKLDKDKLIHLVADLYKKNKSVKEYFDFYVNPNEKYLFDKHRNKIFEAFYPCQIHQ